MASTETVTVASKLPHGMKLRVFKMSERDEAIMGGGVRAVKFAEELPESFTILGVSHPQTSGPRGLMVGGFVLTSGVPKDLWDLWLVQNKDSDIVKNGMIFAHVKDADVQAQAKEKAKLRSGVERLDPANLPKGIQKASAN